MGRGDGGEEKEGEKKEKRSGVRVNAPSFSLDCFLVVLLCMEVNGGKVKHSPVEVVEAITRVPPDSREM